jgi:hypothetical protein
MEQVDSSKELMGWNYPEFDNTARSNAWYLWYGIIASFFIVLGVLTDNFLFSIIIILATLIVFLRNWRRPGQIHFAVLPQGIQVGRTLYPMKDIKEFWIVYQPQVVEMLYFEFNSAWRPLLAIPLQGNNPLQIRELLLEYLPENLEKDEEPTADAIARILHL